MRKATLNDVKDIHKLINEFAKNAVMLPRSLSEIYENIRDFWIIDENSEIIGCCALHTLWENMAEIKSLAVKKKFQGCKYGAELVKACLDEAIKLKAKEVFALTYIPEFFEKFAFKKGKKESMPQKIWTECIKCPHFPNCGEVLVVKKI